MKYVYSSLIVLAFVLTIGISANVSAQQNIVVPNQFANMSGFPQISGFNCANNGPTGARSQTLFPADQLSEGIITGLRVRLFPGSPGSPAVTIPNVTIKLSTTSVEPGSLDPIFANNVGPDETVVFQGDFNLPTVPACNTDPCPFPPAGGEHNVPFPYDPADGNLLVDIMVPPCTGGVPANVQVDSTDDLSSVVAFGFDSARGVPVSVAFITEVVYSQPTSSSIPTLSEWGLIIMAGILGILGFIVIKIRKETA